MSSNSGEMTLENKLNEAKRVAALQSYQIMDSGEDHDFDALTALASVICQIPIALITFIDEDRQWFKSHHGTGFTENKREWSFCTHAISGQEEIMIVPDATLDERFADNPMVTGPTKVVFYAGVSLVNEQGFALGTLCVLDQQSHVLSAEQILALKTLAKQVVDKVELRRKIAQLEVANKAKEEFLGIVSHELKTPITTLKANLQLMDRIKDRPGSDLLPRLIESSTRSMTRINTLLDDLLNMHSYNQEHLRLEKSTFNIAGMLGLCCNHIRLDGKHELIVEGDLELSIHADEHRIDQVVINFVNNAVKYAPESKEIYLIVSKEAGFAKIAVRDSGPGISAEQVPHLFDRYWRADYSSAKYTGLGLGLYICSEIVTRHQGRIGVESTPGKGSTFWFTIPLTEPGNNRPQ